MPINWTNVQAATGSGAINARINATNAIEDNLGGLSDTMSVLAKKGKEDLSDDHLASLMKLAIDPNIQDNDLQGRAIGIAENMGLSPTEAIGNTAKIVALRNSLRTPDAYTQAENEFILNTYNQLETDRQKLIESQILDWESKNPGERKGVLLGFLGNENPDDIIQGYVEATNNTGMLWGAKGGLHLLNQINEIREENENGQDPIFQQAIAVALKRAGPVAGWIDKDEGFLEDILEDQVPVIYDKLLKEHAAAAEKKKKLLELEQASKAENTEWHRFKTLRESRALDAGTTKLKALYDGYQRALEGQQ